MSLIYAACAHSPAAITVNGQVQNESLRPLGAKLAPANVYTKSQDGKCTAATANPGFDYFDASGAAVAPTEFVEFTVTTAAE